MKKIRAKRVIQFLVLSCFPATIEKPKTLSIASIHHLMFAVDDALSDQSKQLMIAYADMLCYQDYNPRYLIDHLPIRFPFIKSVSVSYQGAGIALVSIDAHQPVTSINSDYIATENGQLFAAHVYSSHLNLLAIEADQESLCHDLSPLVSCVMAINKQHIGDTYHISWHSEHKISLYDPVLNIDLICTAEMIENFAQVEVFKEKIMHKIIPDGTTTAWMADIRFKDQIIMAMEKRGNYGKNI